jgi:biotin-dependent carboxylase-like uncharacterized protein
MMEVIRPGLLDLVMDLGRPGFRAQGVPEGGAADAPALILASRLVGNADRAAGLELLLRGPALRFPEGGRVALAGADMQARLDGAPAPHGRMLEIPPGGELELGQATSGLRAYLAVAGGIDAPLVLGSRSTFFPGGFGGWRGRALKAGDRLPLGTAPAASKGVCLAPVREGPLRLLPGPQLAGFADGALKTLTAAEFRVGADSNRLGLRLSGPALEYAGSELASQAVLPGAVQVPPDGQPIILGWDGPVTGGYPVIAGIIAADLPRLAQFRPGDALRFSFATLEEAQIAWHQHQEHLNGAMED